MPAYQQTRIVPFSAEQMYQLVVDITSYPDFIPWISHAYVYQKKESSLLADLVIGYKLLSLSYTSHVTYHPPHRIQVEYVKGPLQHLENSWEFKSISETQCEINFKIQFEFAHPLLKRMMENMFHEAVHTIVSSFEKRAHQIYL